MANKDQRKHWDQQASISPQKQDSGRSKRSSTHRGTQAGINDNCYLSF